MGHDGGMTSFISVLLTFSKKKNRTYDTPIHRVKENQSMDFFLSFLKLKTGPSNILLIHGISKALL